MAMHSAARSDDDTRCSAWIMHASLGLDVDALQILEPAAEGFPQTGYACNIPELRRGITSPP
jgi:hypothetical protein